NLLKQIFAITFSIALLAGSAMELNAASKKNNGFDRQLCNAYMKAARAFVELHIFPDGEKIDEDMIDDEIDDFSNNKLAICDVNGDGKPELLVRFEATFTAAMRGYICGFDKKKLTIELGGFPSFDFFDNGCLKANVSHNHTLAGEFWPYSLLKFNRTTGKYDYIAFVDAWSKEDFPKDFDGNPFPDDIDRVGDGFIYYIESDEPVDTPVYEKWIARYLGGAKPVEPDWVSADAKGLRALEKKLGVRK
ncbi:MAG: hypothetical protein IJ597_07380, partial [Synergistaceae bacterium]|nr:hypothetical protein [Synergistaceae bacterium]